MRNSWKVLKKGLCACFTIMCLSFFSQDVFAKTQQDACDWAKSKISMSIDQDGSYGAQCVDLIFAYYEEFWGINRVPGNANDFITNSLPSGWQRIEYYNGFSVEPGDIVIWSRTSEGLGEQYGHIGIALSGDTGKFTTIEQYAYGSVDTHSRSYDDRPYMTFWGVIRPSFNGANGDDSTKEYVPDGLYYIKLYGSNLVVDVDNAGKENGTNVQAFEKNNTSAQQWQIINLGSNVYHIINGNNMALEIAWADKTEGSNVQIYENNGTDTQKWYFKKNGNGSYSIYNVNSNLVLDLSGGNYTSGTNLQGWGFNGTSSQQFNLEKVDQSKKTYYVYSGYTYMNGNTPYYTYSESYALKRGGYRIEVTLDYPLPNDEVFDGYQSYLYGGKRYFYCEIVQK